MTTTQPSSREGRQSMASAATPDALLYITGCGHSGSTLLDMMLGGHSRISALGEVHRLYLNALSTERAHRCTCTKLVLECPFWQRVASELQKTLGVQDREIFQRLPTTDPKYVDHPLTGDVFYTPPIPKLFRFNVTNICLTLGWARGWQAFSTMFGEPRARLCAIDNSLLIFDAVRRVWNTPIIVDSTKNVGRLKGLHLRSKIPMRILYLLRDGRGVAYSRMRRKKITMADAAKVWVKEHAKAKLALLTVPKSSITYLRYEDLCRDPKRELTGLCESLSISFEAEMLSIRSPNRHNLGGNPMRFRANENRLSLDERWRTNLSRKDLAEFDHIAAKLNRKFGYD